jgi:hypothetical protein
MRKVLCSMGFGPHADLLAVSGETFRVYAERHAYELDFRTDAPSHGRGPAWESIRIIQDLLAHYDLVLWIDADAAVVDASVDIASLLGRRDLMALSAHNTPEGAVVPNLGVWLLRASHETQRFLDDVWNATEFLDHKWMENGAVIDRLGYEVGPPVRLRALSPMGRRTKMLTTEWNSIPADPSPKPRIVHFPATPMLHRLAGLKEAAAQLRVGLSASPTIS